MDVLTVDIGLWVQSAATLVTAVAAIALTWLLYRHLRLTRRILAEGKAVRAAEVYVDLEFSSYEMRLVVGNSGTRPARNLTFTVTDPIPWRASEEPVGFAWVPAVAHGISYLAPGRILRFRVGPFDWNRLHEGARTVEFTVAYQDELNSKRHDYFVIDLDQYRNVLLESFANPATELARAIRRVERKPHLTSSTLSKPCTFCGTRIAANAIKCPYCSEFQESARA